MTNSVQTYAVKSLSREALSRFIISVRLQTSTVPTLSMD